MMKGDTKIYKHVVVGVSDCTSAMLVGVLQWHQVSALGPVCTGNRRATAFFPPELRSKVEHLPAPWLDLLHYKFSFFFRFL